MSSMDQAVQLAIERFEEDRPLAPRLLEAACSTWDRRLPWDQRL